MVALAEHLDHLVARLLAMFAAVFPVLTVLGDRASAGRMRALLLSHKASSISLRKP
jgi:hypothetical protein